jgi:xanthine phosphoribosyltransferase
MKQESISWVEFHENTKKLAKNLIRMERKWKAIVAVARSGLIPASIIAREMGIYMIDVICPFDIDNGHMNIIKVPNIKDGENILLVDEFVNSGLTLKSVKEKLPKAFYASVYVTECGKHLVDLYTKEIENVKIIFPWDATYTLNQPLIQNYPTLWR